MYYAGKRERDVYKAVAVYEVQASNQLRRLTRALFAVQLLVPGDASFRLGWGNALLVTSWRCDTGWYRETMRGALAYTLLVFRF